MRFYISILIGFVVLFSSCLKEDKPVAPHQAGTATTGNFNMGENYRFQYYFDLETNTVVGQNLKSNWDLAFDTRNGKFSIKVNYAKLCKIANTGQTDFAAVTDTTGLSWRVDAPSGNLDSTAIGNWGTFNNDTAITNGIVYVINRGVDENQNMVGVKKIKVDGANNSFYRVTFANLDGSELSTVTVPKDAAYNFSFLSLNNGGEIVTVQPPKATWDIEFSQYTTIFYIPYLPYLVTGVLNNHTGVVTAADSTNTFDSIVLADTATHAFYSNVNIIGFDWKSYNFQTAQYTVKPYKNYVVRSRNGLYYKLRFLDFYKDGIKGNILFEYQLL